MRVYVKKAVRELKRLVTLQEADPQPTAFDLNYMDRYVLLGKNLLTGRTHPYSLELHRQIKECVLFSEDQCMEIYHAALKEMRNNPNIRLGIFDTAACSDEPKFWKPRKTK